MKKVLVIAALAALACSTGLSAQMTALTYGEDFTVSDEVYQVTTVRVAPNRINHYLAGIQKTWVPASQIGQEMGLNEGHAIYVSELPQSGDYNVTLVLTFANLAQREKGNDPEVAAAYNKKVEENLSREETFEMTEGYTQIREITGDYLVRQVAFE